MSPAASQPIFIHSLFRAGSTYIFNTFRRSSLMEYWAYQEPLNERLLYHAQKPGGFLVAPQNAHKALRHPKLDKPHNFEFHVATHEIVHYFKQEFPYAQYFNSSEEQLKDMFEYFGMLCEKAKARPVFQCCRTSGRMGALRKHFNGVDLFLLRNPWDQWWSYKQDNYFLSKNLYILYAQEPPEFINQLKKALLLPEFQGASPEVISAFCANRRLTPDVSYQIFFGLWCHALLEARKHCDLIISIDELSRSKDYRNTMIERLRSFGVTGLVFEDCSVSSSDYGSNEIEFFRALERKVISLLSENGCTEEEMDYLQSILTTHQEQAEKALSNHGDAEAESLNQLMRAREYALQLEKQLADTQTALFQARARINV